jgi:16S rRNA (adenine1518-N6/adenine1519-N6)-dimethyltransferase
MTFHAKKSLGQNFLKSKEAIRTIVSAAELKEGETVLEVGPGKGILTGELLAEAEKVIAVEKDSRLIDLLKEKFSMEIEKQRFELIEKDILEFDETILKSPYKLVANIPYYITGQLLRKFLESERQPERMVLMLQKEVAERIVARDLKESILSISVKAYSTPKYIMKVARKYFSPEPNVDSAILLIDDISKDFFKDIPEKKFFEVVKLGFAHKRKMLMGNLSEKFNKEKLEKLFLENKIPPKSRAEDIKLEDWKKISLSL